MDPVQLTNELKQAAQRLGFDRCRVVAIAPAPHADFFEAWLSQGRAGEMAYLERYRDRRRDPHLLVDATAPPLRSMIVLAVNHYQFTLPPDVCEDPSRGIIASYAWGNDYHDLIRPVLRELDAFICSYSGRETPGKGLVDTGPVLERDWAHVAGIGFTGKNCCTIHPEDGSWLLLATLSVPELFAYDTLPQPVNAANPSTQSVLDGLPAAQDYGRWLFPAEHDVSPENLKSKIENPKSNIGACGRCTRCLDACPTQAFVGPYHLDPQRCISYWTIEARKPIPRDLRPLFGNRIFGCDICQEVCPWNQRLPARRPRLAGLQAQQGRLAPPLLDGFQAAHPYWLDEAAFRAHFHRSPVLRAKRRGMLRNVCVALGNWADPTAVPSLIQALHDPEALARGHAAWALGRIWQRHGDVSARLALYGAQDREADVWVRDEIQHALA